MPLIRWMANNSVASNLLMMVFLIGGLVALPSIKQEVFPEFELDRIEIITPYLGATPTEVEESIVIPMEESLEGLSGIKEITSSAYEGAGRLSLELEKSANKDRVLSDVKSTIDRLTTLPQNAEEPEVSLVTFAREVMTVAVYGDLDEIALYDVSQQVKDRLLANEGITKVELSGTQQREISIEISQEQLRAYQLSLPQVVNLIRQSTLDLPGGKIKARSGDILVRTKERRYQAYEYANIPVLSTETGQVLLGDIAHIEDQFEEVDRISRFNNQPAVLVNISRVGEQKPIDVSRAVKAQVEDIRKYLPSSVKIQILYDRSVILQDRIQLLVENATLGLILVIVLLAMFLELKLAFWIMLGIPISFLGALFLMPGLDASINMLSLFAFILVLGVVVDDAIVVGENIYAHQEMEKEGLRAAVDGTLEIASPVLIAILTTAAAFTPLFFVSGTMGKFFKVIPVIVLCVLLISLLESLFILPSHLAHSRRSSDDEGSSFFLLSWIRSIQQRVNRSLIQFIQGPYQRALGAALKYRYITIAIGVALIIFNVGLIASGHIKFIFFPRVDSDRISASLKMPFGTPVQTTERATAYMVEKANEILAEYEQEKARSVSFGISSLVGGQGRESGSHLSSIRIFLEPLSVRGFSAKEFSEEWRRRVGLIPGVDTLSIRATTGPGSGPDIDIEFSHPDFVQLEPITQALKTRLSEYPGVYNVEDSYAEYKPEFQLKLTEHGAALGLSAQDLAQQVRGAFQGLEALRFQRGPDEMRVRVRLPKQERESTGSIEGLMIRLPGGGEVALSEVAHIKQAEAYNEINRIHGYRVIRVKASVNFEQGNPSEIVASLKQDIFPALTQRYPGFQAQFAGANQDRRESIASLRSGSLFALMVIFCLLALQFKSYLQPTIVMLAIPFGVIGAVGGHLLMGFNLSIISMLGLVALIGIVVNDSLVLVDFINQRVRSGYAIYEALLEAGTRRFRPILLTSLTTFFGLMPMIFEQSLQARFLIPMAISLAFGTLFATVITLLLIPVMYLILEDIKSVKSRVLRRVRA